MCKLKTVLTYGWDETNSNNEEAEFLNSHPDTLEQNLMAIKIGDKIFVKNLDKLFRRTPSKIRNLSKFVSALLDISRKNGEETKQPETTTFYCSIDAFAYAYLIGAKNYDFFMEETNDIENPFRKVENEWRKKIVALAQFERFGRKEKGIDDTIWTEYLELRKIVSRPSARDERRALVVLLYSGPSTVDELVDELALNTSLIQRIVHSFLGVKIVDDVDGKFKLSVDCLPIVLFVLRETMGVDPMSSLERGA